MKKLITLVCFCPLFLGLIALNFDARATPQDAVAGDATVTRPSCPTCDGNLLSNWSFEDNVGSTSVPSTWKTYSSSGDLDDISFDQNSTYRVCGDEGATFSGKGYFYQDVTAYEGAVAVLKIFGARHSTDATQKFSVSFLNSSGDELANKDVSITNVWNDGTMTLYTITTAAAPAGTTKIRVKGSMAKTGGWIKVDAACLTVTYCEECAGNLLLNPSFETTEVKSGKTVPTVWKVKKTGTNDPVLESSTLYKACGTKGATLGGNNYFYQDVAISAGSNVTLKIWGARHTDYDQVFQLVFLNSSGGEIGTFSTDITKDVDASPWGLQKYTINVPFAPDGTTKVSVRGFQTNGDAWIKVDQACLTVVEQCACNGNKLENPSFETTPTEWKAGSPAGALTSALPTGGVGCGTKFGVLTGAGGVYQSEDFTKNVGAKVDLVIWGATSDASKDQVFKLTFYNGTSPMTGNAANKSVQIDNVFSKYLTMYSLSTVAPTNATSVRLELVNTTGVAATKLYIDAACLKITTDGALPVTLVDFAVKKEQSSALLSWSTTAETNSSEFEVQHSENGKGWNKIGSVEANGESKDLVRYNFVHNEPANGSNFYRLKMIDLDNSYSFSRILTINLENSETVQVYPNPTMDYMKLTMGKEKIVKVQLYNTQGVMVLETKPDSSDVINLAHLKPGSYVVKINQLNGITSTRRIQVVK